MTTRLGPRSEPAPIEIATDHRCLLGEMTDRLGERASSGLRGRSLAERAGDELAGLLVDVTFERCCLPAYLALAPKRFDREIQLPIACATPARLDTRVLLWPVGAKDGQHPHCDGWAAFMAVQGDLTADEVRHGKRQPARAIALRAPELLFPEQDVSHHIHNVGDEIGLTIHVFGK
jgi:hypothetical protein